jgi:hypothetical protein
MSSPRTEEFFAQIRSCLRGELPTEELVSSIEAVIRGMEEKLKGFLHDTEGNPEIPQQIRTDIAQALETYVECLTHMRDVTVAGDMTALGESGLEAQQRVDSIRSVQSAHREALSAGPTHFPYLNRLIIQYDSVRSGRGNERLLALLADAPNFSQWLRTELAVRTASPEEVQMVFHLEQFITALKTSLEAGESLPDIQEDLTTLSSHLASLLAEPPDPEATDGPTPIIAVNQVFAALSSCTGEKTETDFLISVIDQCRIFLRTILPIDSSGKVVAKLDAVLASLDDIETCMKEQTGYEELVEAAGALESSANILAETVTELQNDSAAEPVEFAARTQGLPAIFRSALLPAFLFLENRSDAEGVFAASDHLELSATEMQREIGRLPQDDPRLGIVSEGLDLMREAASLLQDLATTGNERVLEYATDLSFQAADKLAEGGIK